MSKFTIVALSDTHGMLDRIIDKIPDGDILIHAGDALGHGDINEFMIFVKQLGDLPHKHKIYVPGNHDKYCEDDPLGARAICEDHGISLLINEQITIEGIKVWGSPITPRFGYWSFMKGPSDIPYYWESIPLDTDILITHGPPKGILDEVPNTVWSDKRQKPVTYNKSCGCPALAYYIDKVKPDLHFFGHIHYSYGEKHENGVSYYNVAIADERYGLVQPITVVDYDFCSTDSPLPQDPDQKES